MNKESGLAGIVALVAMLVISALGTGLVTVKKPAQINIHTEVLKNPKAEYTVNK